MGRRATGQVVERLGKTGTSYGLRFRANGSRHYVTAAATTRDEAEIELQNILADVRRGIWSPPAKVQPVVEERHDPGFHRYASDWLAAREPELQPRSVDALRWALVNHLLPHFAKLELAEITPAEVDRYRLAKVRARDQAQEGRRTLSNRSINATLATLAQILDDAIEDGLLVGANPARGRKRRLRAERPRRTWLEIDELRVLLEVADDHRRPLIALMALAGLRVSEACALTWGAVDLANGRLHVFDSKTAAGIRVVDMSPMLRDELTVWKVTHGATEDGSLVFTTRQGRQRNRHNVRANVLLPTLERANNKLVERGRPSIKTGVTNHSLRRTFCALLFEAGATPPYVKAQMGHTSAALALEVYAQMMARDRDTGLRVDELLRGPDWTQDSQLPISSSGDAMSKIHPTHRSPAR